MGKKKRDTTGPTDAELLVELSTLDEVSAWVPTVVDHDNDITPSWCELVLEIKREADRDPHGPGAWPLNARLPLRRHDGELIIQVLHDVLHPKSGGQVVPMLWSELDEVVDRIQGRIERGKDPLKADVGMAQGLARAIAIMTNPFAYDEDAVKAEAMERFEARTA